MMNKLKKALIGSILISVILAVTLGYVWATNPTTSFYISTGVYPGAPDYTAWYESDTSTYFIKNKNGYIISNGLDISTMVMAILNAEDGCTFYFSSGTYDFTSICYIPSNVTMCGAGFSSVITSTTMTGEAIFRSKGMVGGNEGISTPQANITITDLHFKGAGNQTAGVWRVQNGFDCAVVTNLKIINNYFENFRSYFAKVWYGTNVIITNNIGEYSYGEGLHCIWGRNIVMSNNIIRHVWDACLAVGGSVNVVISGNTVEDTSTTTNPIPWGCGIDISGSRNITVSSNSLLVPQSFYGIMSCWFDNVAQPCVEQVIIGNTIQRSNTEGIYIFGRQDQGLDTQYSIVVTGNKVSYSGESGIFFCNTGWSIISNNYVLSSSQAADDTWFGIYLYCFGADNNQSRIVINGNYIIDTAVAKSKYAMNITSGSTNTVIINNVCWGQSTGYIWNASVAIIHNNVLNDVWTP